MVLAGRRCVELGKVTRVTHPGVGATNDDALLGVPRWTVWRSSRSSEVVRHLVPVVEEETDPGVVPSKPSCALGAAAGGPLGL